ncbi:MAG: serine/threonine protein kinase [Acidobacteriota bacterium]
MVTPAHQRSRHLAPGDRLGKYELIRQIAIGGMAELYLARTTGIEGFEKLVVVKRILPQHAASQSFVTMFLNEARLAATLHHPNIAQVYDIGVEDGDYFFAMEYVHGEDLTRIASASNEQGVPISMDAALTLATGLCAGLHYAHEKVGAEGKPLHIVHRDVSPSNVLVSYDGAVKLVDFGIARASSRPGTTQGGLKGKIAYMSPEQCTSKSTIDRRSDVFSVGTLIYELTTGQLPFTGETEYQVLSAIVSEDAVPPSRLVPEYPPALERIVLRALARDADTRYANARELQGALEDFAHENRLRVSPLVLGRLMGTLFPERIEEWAHAKAQGAFFVEQHVVRTLIEAGKTPDPDDAKLREALAAMRAKEAADAVAAQAAVSDDDTTSVTQPPPGDNDTAIGPPPALAGSDDSSRVPVPVAGSGFAPDSAPALPPAPRRETKPGIASPVPGSLRPGTPPPQPVVPGMPGAVPIVVPTSPGRLVSAMTPPVSYPVVQREVPPRVDVTERVRATVVPRPLEDTIYIRGDKKRARWPLFLSIGAVLIAGGAGAYIALGTGGEVTAPAARAAEPAAQVAPSPPPAPPVAAEPAPAPPAEPKPEPASAPPAAPAEPKPAAAEPTPAAAEPKPVAAEAKPAPPAKKVVHAAATRPHPRPDAKPAKEPEPKEPTKWNADSPFMPVRPGK